MNFLTKNACYIYIGLRMMYYLQQMLMISGIIAQTVFFASIMISFYAFYQVNRYYRTGPFIKWLNIMLVILSIYGIIPIIGGWSLTGSLLDWVDFVYLQKVYGSLLPIYVFYYYSLTRRITSDNLKYIYIAFLIFSILAFYQRQEFMSDLMGTEEVINNTGFYFIPLIPMLLLLKIKDFWKYLFILVDFAFILMSVKRGAILGGSIMILLFIIHSNKVTSWKRLSYLLCLSLAILIAAYFFTVNFYAESDILQRRVRQTLNGDSSGRDWIYSNYFHHFIEKTSALEFLIGNGANATWVLFGDFAHNDWLEFAINQGALGIIMNIIFWAVLIWEWKHFKGLQKCRQVFGALIVAYFLMSLHSMSIDMFPAAATLCIGYCLAMNEKAKTADLVKVVRNRILDGKNSSFD